MKVVLIITLVLMLNLSCQETRTVAVESDYSSNKNPKQQTEESAKINLRLIGTNTCGLFDFVFSKEKEIIGIGIGSEAGIASADKQSKFENNSKEVLFVCSSNDFGRTWQGEKGIPYERIGTILGITEFGNGILIGAADGSIWGKYETKWQPVHKPKSNSYGFRFIEFSGNEIGFAVSETEYGSQVFKTQNGGKDWHKVYENQISGHPFDLLVLDKSLVIIAMNDNYVLRTEDGGKTWKPQELENTGRTIKDDDWIDLKDNGASDLTLTSNGIVWVVGKKGSLYYSGDKGKSWKRPDKMPDSIQQQELKSIAFSTSGKGVAVGENGYIIITEDHGKTWNEVPQNALKKNISESDVTKKLERLIKVKFNNENAIILGLEGVYEISF